MAGYLAGEGAGDGAEGSGGVAGRRRLILTDPRNCTGGTSALFYFPFCISSKPYRIRWCARGDSNPQAFRHRILNPARIPIPPLARWKCKGVEYVWWQKGCNWSFAFFENLSRAVAEGIVGKVKRDGVCVWLECG